MPWNMTPVAAGASEKVPIESVTDDAKTAVEEGFAFFAENPSGQRLVIPFATVDDRDDAGRHIRSYCEARPNGRLTASLWHGFTGVKGEGENAQTVFYAKETEAAKTPALSVKFVPYVKRTRAEAAVQDAADQPPATAE